LSIAWLQRLSHSKTIGERSEVALGRGQAVYVGRLATGNHASMELPRPKQL
jgi:hypothetical protein